MQAVDEPILAAREVTRVFRLSRAAPPLTAVDKVSLEIGRGGFVAISGPSGSGKSTLLNLLGCIDTPSSGAIQALGREVSSQSKSSLSQFRLRHIGLVFQRFNLIEHLTALENVALPLQYLRPRPGSGEMREKAESALADVGLADRIRHHPSQLSGGEQQRVGVARALVNDPDLLLADEPTGELDTATGAELIDLLMHAREERGTTLVIVSHDPNLAGLADRQVRMVDGRIASEELAVG
jgi:putative ABC transport system ATP-binding protein